MLSLWDKHKKSADNCQEADSKHIEEHREILARLDKLEEELHRLAIDFTKYQEDNNV